MDLPPYLTKATALTVNAVKPYSGIIEAKEFPELHKFNKYISLSNFFIISRTSKKSYNLSNLKLQFDILKFVKKNNPDIIHCSSFLNKDFFLFLYLYSKKNRLILNVHDPIPHSSDINNKKLNLIRKANFFNIKNVVLFSNIYREEFLKRTQKYNFEKILISKLGVYDYLKDFKIVENTKDKFKILFFGRIEEYKGVNVLLDAFSEIEANYTDIELIIAGKGEFKFDIEIYKKNPKIIFLNKFIENVELATLINDASVIVCPYLDATQSGVLMCAFALNKPVIATNVGAFSEVIEDGKTGFIIEANNSGMLAEKINYLINNRKILGLFSGNIQEKYFLGKNSWASLVNDITRFYKTILKR
jgi:glycosyltransferase involved in cell wall biosynthesis